MAEKEEKKMKRKVVLASGTFDLLHMGHVKYLEEAKKAGGENAELIVIVARDKTVEKRKGAKPVVPEDHRRALVEALKVVDEAILGFEDFSMDKVIERIKPDIIAVGHDQDKIAQQVQEVITRKGLDIKVVQIGKFGKDELNSSLKIKRKIIALYRR
jgi:FAD synthetase